MVAGKMKQGYNTRQVAQLLKIPESRVRSFARAGVVGRRRTPGSLSFDFRDMMVLKMAKSLSDQGLGHRRVEKALRALRSTLPVDRPLSGLKLSIREGVRSVVARHGDTVWEAESGQYQLALGDAAPMETLSSAPLAPIEELPLPPTTVGGPEIEDIESAQGWFEIAISLEEHDAERAYQAYLRALVCDPEHAEAMINLGRLCSSTGDAQRAASYFRLATLVDPDQAIGHFNLGVTLHDLGQLDAATVAYERALERDPDFGDAHYNLATLLEERGEKDAALKHMAAYRRLFGADPEPLS